MKKRIKKLNYNREKMVITNNILIIDEDPPANEDGMTEGDRIHFGTYYGVDAYAPIYENNLWDLEYLILKELTFAIRKMVKYQWVPAGNCFRANPKEYSIDKFKLKNFTEKDLLKLREVVEKLIEFKEKLKMGWPYTEY